MSYSSTLGLGVLFKFRFTFSVQLQMISLVIISLSSYSIESSSLVGKVVYGINAGGSEFVDSSGIYYGSDHLNDGISSDYGKRFLSIERPHPSDIILYQTERYSLSNFGYKIPIKDDGDYVLVLKFCEVYFLNSGKKIFSVALNEAHLIVEDLDIFDMVGHAVAHDEIIPFKVRDSGKVLSYKDEESPIKNHLIRLDFIKGPADNPKINAFYVLRGTVEDVPTLAPYAKMLDIDKLEEAEAAQDNSCTDEEYDQKRKDVAAREKVDEALILNFEKRRIRLDRKAAHVPSQIKENQMSMYQLTGAILLSALTVLIVYKVVR